MGNKKRQSGVLLTETEMKKRYPDSGLASEIYVDEDDELKLPCRNLSINDHIGGGVGYGKILELIGEESTGKTLLAQEFVEVCQSLGGIALWDDAESTFDARWAKRHNIDLKRLVIFRYENVIQTISDWIYDQIIYWRSKLVNNEPILFVIDSLAVMETKDAMDIAESDTKAEMGRRSYEFGKFLRKRTKIFAKYGVCCIFINQTRVKVGASQFEDPEITPLAQVMKYYASQRVGLYRGKKILRGNKDKGEWVGRHIYMRTKKNKSAPPRDSIRTEVYFTEDDGKFGYHRYHGFDALLLKKGLIKTKNAGNKGKAFIYKGEVLCHGEEAFKKLIASDDKLRSRFIKKLGINTVSKTRTKIESIKHNMFKVKITKQKEDETKE